MKNAPGELGSSGETKPRRKGSWSLKRWLLLIALVLIAHIVLIFTFGGRKPVTPRAVKDAPELTLAGGSGDWLALDDPTLFALPSREGFAGPAWLEAPRLEIHVKDWTEKPRFLPLPTNELGALFNQFMQTNRSATFRFDLKPPPQFAAPEVPLEPKFAETSTLRIEGGLAQRQLLTPIKLPSWPYADVIAPSKVQVVVNAAGNVVSTVLLSSCGYVASTPLEVTPDQRALDLARAARFTPSSGLTVGKLIFKWHTVAPTVTNTPAVAPPVL
jgi:hypothetical protein